MRESEGVVRDREWARKRERENVKTIANCWSLFFSDKFWLFKSGRRRLSALITRAKNIIVTFFSRWDFAQKDLTNFCSQSFFWGGEGGYLEFLIKWNNKNMAIIKVINSFRVFFAWKLPLLYIFMYSSLPICKNKLFSTFGKSRFSPKVCLGTTLTR